MRQSIILIGLLASTAAFAPATVLPKTQAASKSTELCASRSSEDNFATMKSSRRSLLKSAALSLAFASFAPLSAQAAADEAKIPMITTDEFLVILRDSARSIQRVEFSGPKAETVRIRLIDGSQFGLSDVVESSTDPRSPLKVQAACREAKVPFKNLELEKILAGAPKKTKMYTNQRVQEAAAKEKERIERLAKDEEQRLADLYKMEQDEAMKKSSSSQ